MIEYISSSSKSRTKRVLHCGSATSGNVVRADVSTLDGDKKLSRETLAALGVAVIDMHSTFSSTSGRMG